MTQPKEHNARAFHFRKLNFTEFSSVNLNLQEHPSCTRFRIHECILLAIAAPSAIRWNWLIAQAFTNA
jgi:hypothetical protein